MMNFRVFSISRIPIIRVMKEPSRPVANKPNPLMPYFSSHDESLFRFLAILSLPYLLSSQSRNGSPEKYIIKVEEMAPMQVSVAV